MKTKLDEVRRIKTSCFAIIYDGKRIRNVVHSLVICVVIVICTVLLYTLIQRVGCKKYRHIKKKFSKRTFSQYVHKLDVVFRKKITYNNNNNVINILMKFSKF